MAINNNRSPYNPPQQLEFCDVSRGTPRPSGSGCEYRGYYVFDQRVQFVAHAAYTLRCTDQHIRNQIPAGAFPNASDIRSPGARKPEYRIPRADIIDYINAACDRGNEI